jgi:hypothetical protein
MAATGDRANVRDVGGLDAGLEYRIPGRPGGSNALCATRALQGTLRRRDRATLPVVSAGLPNELDERLACEATHANTLLAGIPRCAIVECLDRPERERRKRGREPSDRCRAATAFLRSRPAPDCHWLPRQQSHARLQAEPCGSAREPAIIERQHLAAVSGCRMVQGIGEIHALSANSQRGLNLLLVLDRYAGQPKKVFEARENLVGRLLGHRPQDPLELQ